MNKKDAFNTQWINIKMNEIVKLEKSEINQKQQIQNERNRYVIFNLSRIKFSLKVQLYRLSDTLEC